MTLPNSGAGNNVLDPSLAGGSDPNAAGAGTDPGATPPPASDPNAAGAGTLEITMDALKAIIPDEIKDRAEWDRLKNPQDLFTNYINAQQTISKSVRIPDATSTPEQIQEFYKKLGKPETKDAYDFEYAPSNEAYTLGKDSFDFSIFQELADEANLSKPQYEALAKKYIDIQNEAVLNYNTNVDREASEEMLRTEQALKAEYGAKYGDIINNISAKLPKLYSEQTIKRMAEAGLFRDADFIRSHNKLTKMMTGDTLFIEGNAVENIPQTLETLTAKRDRLMQEDYAKNKQTVNELNQQIVKLKMAQSGQVGRFKG